MVTERVRVTVPLHSPSSCMEFHFVGRKAVVQTPLWGIGKKAMVLRQNAFRVLTVFGPLVRWDPTERGKPLSGEIELTLDEMRTITDVANELAGEMLLVVVS